MRYSLKPRTPERRLRTMRRGVASPLGAPWDAVWRLRVITPLLDWRRGAAWNAIGPDGRLCRLENMRELVRYVAARRSVSQATVWRWWARFRSGAASCSCSPRQNDCSLCGFAALRDKPRADKGRARFFAAHPATADAVRRFVAEGRSTCAIHRALQTAFAPAPCYETVRDFVGALRSGVPR